MGLKAIPMRAETGPIGGDLSHEFVILAETGESEIAYHRDFRELTLADRDIDYDGDLQPIVDAFVARYAATDEQRDPEIERSLGADLETGRGIEVGHIFYFGTKYSEAMNATVTGPGGEEIAVEMGSYGIGVSRLVGAIIEASHDDAGIIWPQAVAPFTVGLINIKQDDPECAAICETVYAALERSGNGVLYDDRPERPGIKFAQMDLIGLPQQVIVGPRGARVGKIELKCRGTGERREMNVEAALAALRA
jgi:prolyl-tRNA synthetase